MQHPKFCQNLMGLFCCLLPIISFSQNTVPTWECANDALLEHANRDPAWVERNRRIEKAAYDFFSQRPAPDPEKSLQVVTLPVVVHIIHNNGPENISDAQVLQGIQQLNEAFANMGYYDQGTGVNTMIQFCLAQRTPEDLPTSGITRDQNTLTNVTLETGDIALKNINRWTPTDYINIWLVREICTQSQGCGVVGYAYFPASHGQPEDGIVMEAPYLGSTPGGTGVLAHEMGHYLGLFHTFEGGCTNNDCLANGDRICDTPPDQSTIWVDCAETVNTCTTDTQSGFATDQSDMILNFMDYTDFACFNDFTPNQADRMNWHINNVRQSLLDSKGCLDPCPNPVTAFFTPSAVSINVGQTVNFTNGSTNASAYTWSVDGVVFSNATNASYTFNTAGVFVVALEAIPANSDYCTSKVYKAVIEVTCPVVADFAVSNTTPDIGETIVIANMSSNATQYEWLLNGISQGTGFSGFTPTATGVYVIRLNASNGFCQQTKVVYVSVQDSCENPTFQKTWGDNNENIGIQTITLADGSLLMAGSTVVNGNLDIYFVKTAPDGTTLWQKRFGGPGADNVRRMLALPDGGWVLVGNIPGPSGTTTPLMARFAADGSVVWQKTISTPEASNAFTDVIITQDGNLLISGTIHTNFTTSSYTGILTKLNLNGTVVWSRLYDSANVDWIEGICEMPNGDIAGVGFTSSFGQNLFSIHDGMAMRFSSNGTLLWVNAYGSTDNEWLTYVFPTSDGGIMTIGATSGWNGPGGGTYMDDAWMIKLSGNGAMQWAKIIHSDQNIDFGIRDVIQTADSGFVFAANDVANIGDNTPLFFKVDALGNIEWSRIYGGSNQGRILSVDFTPQGYVFTGYSSANNKDAWLLKTDEAGIAGQCPEFPHLLTNQVVQPIVTGGQLTAVVAPTMVASNLVVNVIDLPESMPCAVNCGVEICNNGIDDDGDGLFDCLDPDCNCEVCDGDQARWWYFGDGAGLDFDTDPPTVLTNGQTSGREASSVATDALGHLLFYTDAARLYNRNHQIMPNGDNLAGHASTTQTLILPQPGKPWRFFVFTPNSFDNLSTGNGLSYSIVNMSLNGGFGDVEIGNKNIPLVTQNKFTEKIAATRHCNGEDWWIVVKEQGNNIFRAYLLTASGLGVPVTSNAGTPGSVSAPNVVGCLKFSPNGRRLANTLFHTGGFDLFDFDNATGIVSNAFSVTSPLMSGAYGIEFSKDGDLLYLTNLTVPSHLWQFDLNTGNGAGILQSGLPLATFPDQYRLGQLQMAPNGKIYVTNTFPLTFTSKLGVIHKPEVSGTGCLYQQEGLGISPGGANLGLPSFPQDFLPKSLFARIEGTDSICQVPYTTVFNLDISDRCSLDSVRWSLTGPGNILAQNTDSITLQFTQAGVATLVARAYSACAIGTDTLRIHLFNNTPPMLDLGPDKMICDNGVAVLHAGAGFQHYRWNDGTVDSTLTTLFPGKYWVDVWDLCGNKQTDTIQISVLPNTVLNLGDDFISCTGATPTFFLPASFVSWEWQPAGNLNCNTCPTIHTVIVGDTTQYIVIAKTPENCLSADTLLIFTSTDTIFTYQDAFVCENETLWFNGIELPPDTVVTVFSTSIGGCDSLFTLTVIGLPIAHTILQENLCNGDTLLINGLPITTDTTVMFSFTSVNGCDSLVQIDVHLLEPPRDNIELAACPGDVVIYGGIEIPAGETQVVRIPNSLGICDSLVTVTVEALSPPLVQIIATDTIKSGTSVQLNPQALGNGPFQWQWGPEPPPSFLSCYDCRNPIATPLINFVYTVSVTDANGCEGSNAIALVVLPCNQPYIPNVFSPNDDGVNDWFYIVGADCELQINFLRIFDRWGELIFEGQDFPAGIENLGWDGKFKDKYLTDNVFVWIAEIQFPDGTVLLKKGDVTLLR